jgi:putative heme-binding domain-containing protein
MLLGVRPLCLLVVFAPALLLAQGERQNPFKNDAGAIEVGRGVFRIACSPCHGIHAEGGRGPNLTIGDYSNGTTDSDLYRVISQGIPYTDMRGYESMGEDNVWRIISFLRSTVTGRAAEKVSGDPASGDKLFWGKGSCGQCHRVGTRGGRLGPELTRIGRARTPKYLLESIVSPNADLTPGYATITVVTRDGKKITGAQRGYDNFSAQFMDAQDNYHSYLKSEVTSMEHQDRSLMPEGYGKMFTKSELDDLVAYLAIQGVKR